MKVTKEVKRLLEKIPPLLTKMAGGEIARAKEFLTVSDELCELIKRLKVDPE